MCADSLPLPRGDSFLHLFRLSAEKHNRVTLNITAALFVINEASAAAVVAPRCQQAPRPQRRLRGLRMIPDIRLIDWLGRNDGGINWEASLATARAGGEDARSDFCTSPAGCRRR